jgi:energy-coupling factor transport system ATP-binding protein
MAIVFEEVSFAYGAGSVWHHGALDHINLRLEEGGFIGIAGETGSGKSTFMQHLNGLLKPTEGKVKVLDVTIEAGEKSPKLTELRRRVGLVFQFPEHQLFEDTVEKDIMFGPLNFGVPVEEAKQRASKALQMVGLSDELLPRNPFQLSGGQMRKVAIASVLAMDPEVIVLDEPTATLDPQSRAELAELLNLMCQKEGKTVIVVTHRMEDMLQYADEWLVMKKGKVIFQGTASEMVGHSVQLAEQGLALPASITYWSQLATRFGLEDEAPQLTAKALAERIGGVIRDQRDQGASKGGSS